MATVAVISPEYPGYGGKDWTEATPTFTQVTANLKILGGDADVDNFLQATYADPNDIEAEVVSSRAKSIAHLFPTRSSMAIRD